MFVVVAEGSAFLLGGQVDTEQCPCGRTAEDIGFKAFLYHHIEYAAGVDSPHTAAF